MGRSAADLEPPEPADPPEAFRVPDGFVARTFGAELVWSTGPHYVARVLRIQSGKQVPISTAARAQVVLLLTGGRAVLEDARQSPPLLDELLPASPRAIQPDEQLRLVALTDVELFVAYAPTPPADA